MSTSFKNLLHFKKEIVIKTISIGVLFDTIIMLGDVYIYTLFKLTKFVKRKQFTFLDYQSHPGHIDMDGYLHLK